MRVLTHFETLVYYDGPELFIAHDQLHVSYVCLLVESTDHTDQYLCIPVSERRLNDLLGGEVDLRTVIEATETGEAYIGTATDSGVDHMEIRELSHDQIPTAWFPGPDFFLHKEAVPDIEVVQEAMDRRRAVVHCSLNPPEARAEPKITADHLGQAVKLIQRVVRHAFRKSLQGLDEKTKEVVDLQDNYELEIFSFSRGSFTLHMQTRGVADMFGYSQVARALVLLDIFNDNIDDAEATVQTVASYGGHLATAYKDLLEFIAETQTALTYEWAMPQQRETTPRTITARQARIAFEALGKRDDLGKEEKRLVGILPVVNEPRGTWVLISDEDGVWYRGKCHPESDVNLSGAVIKTQRYEFLCEEHLEEEAGTGKERTVLLLKSFHAIS